MSETGDLLELGRLIRTGQARRTRKTAGVATASLAKDLGVTAATVRRWETGAVTPPPARALAYLALLRRIGTAVRGMSGGG